jgi:hypothetical protein
MEITSLLETEFPSLKASGYQITSDPDKSYNCIAWAGGCSTEWWWPAEDDYWPSGVPRVETLEAFEAAFATLGYARCNDGGLEQDFEKIAVYAVGNTPKHAARQEPDGGWTSKLGRLHDIKHDTAEAIVSASYGSVARFLRRLRRVGTNVNLTTKPIRPSPSE